MNDAFIPLDNHSLQILLELQRDARQTVQQIAEKVGPDYNGRTTAAIKSRVAAWPTGRRSSNCCRIHQHRW